MTTTRTIYGIHSGMGPQRVIETLADNGDTIYTSGSWIAGTVEVDHDAWAAAKVERAASFTAARARIADRVAARAVHRASALEKLRAIGLTDDEILALQL